MSQISQKSITGITSITTPVGIDDVFTVHSGDTTERFRVDQSGNQNISGIVTATNFKTGVSNLHNLGLTLSSGQLDVGSNIKVGNAGVITATAFHGSGASLTGIDATALKDPGGDVIIQAQDSGAVYAGIHTFTTSGAVFDSSGIKVSTGATISHVGNATFTGIVTASSFIGDGSDLTNLPAGLGTALSATATSPLNKMYYTNQVLGVPSSVTVDVPASASKAYTQYADIKVESSADLIIAEGDDLIPDVLGLADFGTFGGGASAGRIRVNSISNAANDGSPTVQKGLVVTGVTTSTTFSGSGASLTNLNASAIASGTVPTARLGSGTASSSTFLAGDSTYKTVTGTTINNNADNRLITGSGTANTLEGEANLTYNGTLLTASGSNEADLLQLTTGNGSGNTFASIRGDNRAGIRIRGGGSERGGEIELGGGQRTADPAVIKFSTNTSNSFQERLRIDSAGRFLKGVTSAAASRSSTSVRYPHFQLSSPWSSGLGSYKIECTDDYPIIFIDSGASYANNSGAGVITWSVKDSSNDYCNTASILSKIDGTPSNDSAPGRLEFHTTTSGATPSVKMTIDSAGRVTKPNTPFVMVHINTNTDRNTTGSYIVVPWDQIHGRSTNSNMGSHFNTSNHRFTAPVDGRYFFCMSLNIVGDNIVKHRINGSDISKAEYRDGNDAKWDHADASFIYDMNANDYYDCVSSLTGSGQRFNSGASTNEGWDTLSIYLLG